MTGTAEENMNKVKQTLGFFSITVAWLLLNVCFLVFSYFAFDDVKATTVVFVWSGFLMLIAWALFVVYPLYLLDHTANVLKLKVFPFATGIYAFLVFLIVIGFIMGRDLRTIILFGPFSFLSGAIFGWIYCLITRAHKLVRFLANNPVYRLFFFLLPFLILALILHA